MGGAYALPEGLRQQLAKPMGRVFSGDQVAGDEFRRLVVESPMVVTVGDRVTDTIAAMRMTPAVQVVDGVERREKRTPPVVEYSRLIKVRNPAGTLTDEAIDGMLSAFAGEKPVRVEVEGEEDLMAMLAISFAPVSAVVFYGQPGVGVVAVQVNGDTKSRNREILAKMGIKRLA